ncbi:MAG: hypothetical protein K2X38_09635 [Gemmataceae bacterium]|nr:hypothetical protein [Gemmataceae bacterium]
MARAKKALASLPWVDQSSVSANVGKQEVRFKLAEPKGYSEQEISQAFAGVDFRNVDVLAKPANAAQPLNVEPKDESKN